MGSYNLGWKQLAEIPGDTFCYQILDFWLFPDFFGIDMIDMEK